MIVNEISLWGAVLIAVIVGVAIIALAFVDRKMLRRMLVIFGATMAQMVVVGAVVLLAFKTLRFLHNFHENILRFAQKCIILLQRLKREINGHLLELHYEEYSRRI